MAKRKAKRGKAKKRQGAHAPRKFSDPKNVRSIIKAFEAGASVKEAVGAIGVSHQCFYDEIDANPVFAAKVKAARLGIVTKIKRAFYSPFNLDPRKLTPKERISLGQLAAKALKIHPDTRDEFCERKEVSGPGGIPLESTVNNVTNNNLTIVSIDDRRRELAALADKLGVGGVVDASPFDPASGHSPPVEPSPNGNGDGKSNGCHHGNGHA